LLRNKNSLTEDFFSSFRQGKQERGKIYYPPSVVVPPVGRKEKTSDLGKLFFVLAFVERKNK
jgi:hypothetical protein